MVDGVLRRSPRRREGQRRRRWRQHGRAADRIAPRRARRGPWIGIDNHARQLDEIVMHAADNLVQRRGEAGRPTLAGLAMRLRLSRCRPRAAISVRSSPTLPAPCGQHEGRHAAARALGIMQERQAGHDVGQAGITAVSSGHHGAVSASIGAGTTPGSSGWRAPPPAPGLACRGRPAGSGSRNDRAPDPSSPVGRSAGRSRP